MNVNRFVVEQKYSTKEQLVLDTVEILADITLYTPKMSVIVVQGEFGSALNIGSVNVLVAGVLTPHQNDPPF